MKKLSLALFAIVLSFGAQNAFAACATPLGAEGDVIYNSTAKMLQFCNGTVWVNASGVAPSAGGGGGTTYAGITTATTDGTPPTFTGLKGMDAMCAAEYAGSRMMRVSDFKYITSSITSADAGSFFCDEPILLGSFLYCSSDINVWLAQSGSPYTLNCQAFSNNSTEKVPLYTGSTGVFSNAACSTLQKVHCVTD